MSVKYPNVTVKLTGADGNVFNLLGITSRALRNAQVTPEIINTFLEEAKSGDYDHAIQTIMKWVNVK